MSPRWPAIALTVAVALTGCGGANVKESRGEPHRGQVTSSRWSKADVVVRGADGAVFRVRPGGSTPRGVRYDRFCIPSRYSGTAYVATDDNPTGFPPTRISGGACYRLTADDVATVTVSK